MAILIVLVGVITITRMSTDIFPNINIPVVSVIWSYPGVGGTAKYLFQPLAMAVIFAMLASYLLSRTVIPTMVKFLLRGAHGGNRYQPRAQLEHFGERTWPAGRIRWVAGLFHGGGKTLRRGVAKGSRGLCAFQQDSFARSAPFFPVFTTASIACLRKFAIVMLKHCTRVSIIAVLAT
jgi:multidrug efflux pump subunit AcrB